MPVNNKAEEHNYRALMQNALLELDRLQTKLKTMEQTRTEPIAIVGMGCRFPGGGNSPAQFWQMLHTGTDGIRELPEGRWDTDAFFDPDPETPGKMYVRHGGFLDPIDEFSPQFFGISPREALSMDPQQRLLLEVCWEALEEACMPADRLLKSRTGVYVGLMSNDYLQRRVDYDDPANYDAYMSTGNEFSFLAGRISYLLGLRGPSMSVATACSSSLVAIHLACQALRCAECDMALAGGVNLILHPCVSIVLSKMQAIAPDGRCKTFDAAANGYARGEGCGVVVLKRLSVAQKDGDRILALIRGTAVNHNGPSGGVTVPNGPAQEALLRQAAAAAGVEPASIGYVEAHGTGTSLGDPIEIQSLWNVMGKSRLPQNPLIVGSVKTNIGHLEAAAGIAGVIKSVLSLQHQTIPPHLHFKNPNPHIAWQVMNVQVPASPTPWPMINGKRIGSVSSFGLSGINAHIVLEEAAATPVAAAANARRPLHILALSARSQPALLDLCSRYETHLASHPDQPPGDVCFSANTGRVHHAHRLSVVAGTLAEAREKLAMVCEAQQADGVSQGVHLDDAPPQIAFLFTGQGAQYVGMGRQLYETQATFRQRLTQCDAILRPYLEIPLLSVIFADETRATAPLDQTAYTQPALFALEYALAHMWMDWGIKPDVLLGHSVGEYVAACLAGVFSLEDGLRLIATRGRLMQSLPQGGAMIAVMAAEDHVRSLLPRYGQDISIAAINGPQSVVLAGRNAGISALTSILEAENLKVTPLTVSHAFHSPLMEPILSEFEAAAQEIAFSPPQIEMISNVSGTWAGTDVAQPGYWTRHIRQPVRFADGIQTIYQRNINLFVETGPRPTLLGMARHCLPAEAGHWLPSLRPGQADWQQVLQSLGELYTLGLPVDWARFDQDYARNKLALPTYPFQRQRYWLAAARQGGKRTGRASRDTNHPILGQRTFSAALRHKECLFESQIDAHTLSIQDHRLFGTPVVPAAFYVEMALAAAATLFHTGHLTLQAMTIHQAMTLPEAGTKQLSLLLTPLEGSVYSFEVSSLLAHEDEPTWNRHASGKVRAVVDGAAPASYRAAAHVVARSLPAASVARHYASCVQRGMQYGPQFQAITQLYHDEDGILSQVQLPENALADARYHLHPVLLDACLQTLWAAVPESPDVYLPVSIEKMTVFAPAGISSLWCRAKIQAIETSDSTTLTADLRLFTEDGAAVAVIEALSLQRVERATLLRGRQNHPDWLYEITWKPAPLPENEPIQPADTPANWLIFADRQGIGVQLAHQLIAHGIRPILVFAGERFAIRAGNQYQVNPANPADLHQLFAKEITCQGIVHLWSLDEEAWHDAVPVAAQLPGCGSVLHLVQAIRRNESMALPRLYLVTRGAQFVPPMPASMNVQQSPLIGLGRVIAMEHPDLASTIVDLDPVAAGETAPLLLMRELVAPITETQIAYRQETRYVARLTRYILPGQTQPPLPIPADTPVRLQLSPAGILENMRLIPMTRHQPGPGEVEIEVRATGLNFRDVLYGLGMLDEHPEMLAGETAATIPVGRECAGTITAIGEGVRQFQVGDAVIAAMTVHSLSSFVVADAKLVIPKPENLPFAAAATLSIPFLTAYYGLCQLANIQAGDRVLIHAAAGGVGQAAVQLAQRAGAEIYATASPGKWAFLESQGVRHVMNSRTLDFASAVQRLTGGKGVDIVLNSLNGAFIPRSLEVLGQNGRFIEIGKIGAWNADQVAAARPDVAYFPFDLSEIVQQTPELITTALAELRLLLQTEAIRPLPHKIFSLQNAVGAFQYMAQANHIGKVVISQREAHGDSIRPLIRPDGSYLITGGLGALGLQTATWLMERGGRQFVLTGRHAISNPSQAKAVQRLEAGGAQVRIVPADVSHYADVARLLQEIETHLPPLRGIIHAAGLLDDGILTQQTWERFQHVLDPKTRGAWNLHRLTQSLSLDFFICYSSAASLLGTSGQGSYAAGNSFMDALMAQRRMCNQPGLSINWGPWEDAGMWANTTNSHRTVSGVVHTINPQQGFQIMETLLHAEATQVGVLPIDWNAFRQDFPYNAQLPFFEAFRSSPTARATGHQRRFVEVLAETPAYRQQELLTNYVQEQVAKVLGWNASTQIEPRQRLVALGVDSLMAVELRNRLEFDLACTLRSTLLFDYPTVEALTAYLGEEHLSLLTAEIEEQEQPETTQMPDDLSHLHELSEMEAEILLLEQLERMRL